MRGANAARDQDAAPRHGAAAELTAVVRAFGLLAAASLLGQAIGFFALVYVAHRVGARGVGQYNFVFAIVSFFGLFGNLGLDTFAVRAIASNRDTRAITSDVVALKLTFAVIGYAVLVASRSHLTNDPVEQSLVPIVGLNLLVWAFTLDWRVLAMRRFGTLASWRLAGQVVYGALVPIFVVVGTEGVRAYAWLNVVGVAVTMVGLVFAVLFDRRTMPPMPSSSRMRARLLAGLPFLYGLAMLQLYTSVDIIMLGSLRSSRQVGIYAIANRLPGALIVLVNVWLNAFFPHAAAEAASNPRNLMSQVSRLVTAMSVLGIGLVVGAILCAQELITWLFGRSFASAGPPCIVLSGAAAVTLIDVTYGTLLQASDSERTFGRAITFGVITNVAANIVLIPAAGALGAAISTLVAEITLGGILIVLLTRRLGPTHPDWHRIVRGLGASCLMAACVLATQQFGTIVAVTTGVVTFFAAGFALGALDLTLISRRPGRAAGAM